MTIPKGALSFVICCLVVVFSGYHLDAEQHSCDEESRLWVAELYAHAISYPDDFPDFVEENRDRYAQNGQWQVCAERLASELLRGALGGPSPDSIEESAYSIASSAGAPEMGSALYDQMVQSRIDMYSLAKYLNELSNAVPEIHRGDLSAYHNTDVYLLSALMSWAFQISGMPPEEINFWRELMFGLNKWYVLQFAQQI